MKNGLKAALPWIAPILIPFVGGFWFRTESKLLLLDERALMNRSIIEKIREDLDRRSSFGPEGFLNGGIRSGLNASIRSETKNLLTKEEFQRTLKELFDKNPSLRRTD